MRAWLDRGMRRFYEVPAWIPMVGFLILGLFFMFRPILLSGFAWMQADPGDTRLNQYILEHSYLWITGNPLHSRFWDSPFFFPASNISAYTEILLGSAPIYWLFRAVGFEWDTSFQLWMIAVSALNYLCAYLLLKRYFRFEAIPSALGGFLFAFAAARVCQIGHEQLLPQFWSPLAVWAILRGFQAPRYLFLGFACLVLQFYSCFYLGWFLAFSICVGFVFCLLHPAYRMTTVSFLGKRWKVLLAGGILSLLALAPMGYYYLEAARVLGSRSFGEVMAYSPQPASWIYLGKFSWLYRWQENWHLTGRLSPEQEKRLGLGFVSLAVVLFSFFKERRNRLLLVLSCISMLIIVLTTQLPQIGNQLWYYTGYKGFPGGASIRCTGRIVVLLLIPAAIAAAAFFQRYRGAWAMLVLCIMVAEQGQSLQYFDKSENRRLIREASELIPAGCRSFYLVAPDSGERDDYLQMLAMWASTEKGIPTLNGYSGNMPPGWNFPATFQNPLEGWLRRNHLGPEDICIVHARPWRTVEKVLF